MHLPATTAPVVEPVTDATLVPEGCERILLVEDNHAVRSVLSATLRGCGYSVVEADSGDDAMRLFRANDASIQLLLTDVVMPGLSGVQLAEALQAAKPDLRVLFVSGYTDDAVLRHGIRAAKVEFMHKPVSPTELAVKVRQILDA
jgi:CheY-like chemotaxis protein